MQRKNLLLSCGGALGAAAGPSVNKGLGLRGGTKRQADVCVAAAGRQDNGAAAVTRRPRPPRQLKEFAARGGLNTARGGLNRRGGYERIQERKKRKESHGNYPPCLTSPAHLTRDTGMRRQRETEGKEREMEIRRTAERKLHGN